MNVYVAHGFQGEHILGVFGTQESAVEALQTDARKLGEPETDVLAIGTPDHVMDGFTVEEFELLGWPRSGSIVLEMNTTEGACPSCGGWTAKCRHDPPVGAVTHQQAGAGPTLTGAVDVAL